MKAGCESINDRISQTYSWISLVSIRWGAGNFSGHQRKPGHRLFFSGAPAIMSRVNGMGGGGASMAGLSHTQQDEFKDQGYLVIRNALDPAAVLSPIHADYSDILDDLAETMRAEERLADYDPTAPFLERVHNIYRHSSALLVQPLNISFPTRQGLPADTPICLPPSIFELTMNEILLDHLESILGPEISSNPIQHVRIKPPEVDIPADSDGDASHQKTGITRLNGLVNQTPWHQDNAVITPDADVTDMLTVWALLTDCHEENGCLLVRPGSHHAGLMPHRTGSTLDMTLDDAFVGGAAPVALPMAPGDVLFLHRHMQHASLANRSGAVRWSLDLRYHRTGQPSGRELLPSFVARSRANPAEECRDHGQWVAAWHNAHARIAAMAEAPPSNRWAAALAGSNTETVL
jgi:phytanoyl-CoA hydroxylase